MAIHDAAGVSERQLPTPRALQSVTDTDLRTAMPPISSHADVGSRYGSVLMPLLLTMGLALGLWLRLVAIGKEGLWLDEIFSASFADLSVPGTVLAVVLFDVHPPLYYLQLNLWGLLGHSDIWLLLNSAFWSAGTLLAIFWGTRRQFGSWAGLLALTFCAVMGSEVYFAHELRMYPMASCLAVLSWIAANRLTADYHFRTAVPLIILLALLGAIHGASAIPASAALLYIFPLGAHAEQLRNRLRIWFGISAVVACTFLPWVVNVGTRDISHTSQPSMHALIQTVSGWAIGYGNVVVPSWAPPAVAAGIAIGLIAALLAYPALTRIAICFIAWPLLFGATLCVIVKPIWLDRTFAFCPPFMAIVFGTAIVHLLRKHGPTARRAIRYPAMVLVAALVVAGGRMAYLQAATPSKPDQYRELASYLAAHAAPGQLVYAPVGSIFWGLNRYLIGPDWGSIIKTQDIVELGGLKRWRGVQGLVGSSKLGRLGLMPESRRLDSFRIPLYTGTSPLPDLPNVQGMWVIASEFNPVVSPSDANLCASSYPAPLKFGRLELYYVDCGR